YAPVGRMVGGRAGRGRLRGRADAAHGLPGAPALGSRAADRGHATRGPGRADRPPDLGLARLLVLGAGYIGAKLAELALAEGHEGVLADNRCATEQVQLAGLAAAGALVETADIREDLVGLLDVRPDVVYLLAAQASRPLSVREPDYTEQTNVSGTRRVGAAVGEAGLPFLVFGSSLPLYGSELSRAVGPPPPHRTQAGPPPLSQVYRAP